MADPVRIQAIRDELDADPVAVGYGIAPGNPDDEAAAISDRDLMMAVGRVVDVETLSGSQIFEAIVDTEWQALAAGDKDDVKFVVSLGDNIQISTGTKARIMLQRALSGATASLAALGVLGSKTVSRAEELGFGNIVIGDIQSARRLP